MLRALLVVFGLGFLGACASLNERECRAGDWYSVGLEDGAAGRLTSVFDRHIKACAKHGVSPVKSDWLEGRERGLISYCTPQNAYRIGRDGRRINPVCTPAAEAAMREPNRAGLKYHDLTLQISQVEGDIDDMEDRIFALAADETINNEVEIAALWLDIRRKERKVRRLEHQRKRYDAWRW